MTHTSPTSRTASPRAVAGAFPAGRVAGGARLYNEAILATSVGSAAMRVTKQFNSGRKLAKTHQNVLVFCKGDPRKAADKCGAVA